ncbi:MAG: Holliday junction resolvase RuvX [Candidatus Beckwithbacteria bacterium]
MRYLGIDFGLRHLGLSLADGPLAQPLVEKTYQSMPQILGFLTHLCQEQAIDQIVIGLPEGQLAPVIKEFAAELNILTNINVVFQDETLTTKEAQAKLFAAHAPQKKRRLDHRVSAALILQDYLDTIKK